MFLIRDIMYCKPGQARPMVQKFIALAKLGQQMGFGQMRVNRSAASCRLGGGDGSRVSQVFRRRLPFDAFDVGVPLGHIVGVRRQAATSARVR